MALKDLFSMQPNAKQTFWKHGSKLIHKVSQNSLARVIKMCRFGSPQIGLFFTLIDLPSYPMAAAESEINISLSACPFSYSRDIVSVLTFDNGCFSQQKDASPGVL